MVFFKKYISVLTSIYFFGFQSTQAFCVYNELSDPASSLAIYDTRASLSSFKQTVLRGGKECCHYSNRECNPSGLQETLIRYHVSFGFNGEDPKANKRYLAICSAGAGLAFRGSSMHDVVAVCNHANGTYQHNSFLELFDI